MMKKILIFGATGNVGSYLTLYAKSFFDSSEYEVIAVGRRREAKVFEDIGVRYFSVDVSAPEDFQKLPTGDVHAVMLLAAQIPSYMQDYDASLYVNSITVGCFNVAEWCRRVGCDRIIFTQTVFDVSLAAEPGKLLAAGTAPCFSYKGDHAMYVIAKNAALEILEHYRQEYGIKKFVFRLPTIYSYSPYWYYYPNGKKTMRPVYVMISRAMKGEPLEVWGDPDYSKDMVYVDDFSQELCLAATVDRDGGMYNIGTGLPVTLREQVETIADVFAPVGRRSEIVFRPELPCGGGFLMDISNAVSDLGYKPQYDCRRLFEAYRTEMAIGRFASLRGLKDL